MKQFLISFLLLPLFWSCNGQVNNNKTAETQIWDLPVDMPNQQHLDKYKLQASRWYISAIIGRDTASNDDMELHKIETSSDNFVYGNSITFHPDNSFESSYSAPCGNDCFPSSTGAYFFADENHIYIKVMQFQQVGDCQSVNIKFQSAFVKYRITYKGDKIILAKT